VSRTPASAANAAARNRAYAARHDEAALDAEAPLHRRLAGRTLPDLTVRVGVQLVDADLTVGIQVGRPGLQPADQGGGEHRGLGVGLGAVRALERVLRRAGRGEDDTAAAGAELVRDLDVVAGAHQRAAGERATVTTVEHQHDPPRLRLVQRVAHEAGRHAGGAEHGQVGVPRCQMQPATRVLDPMAGEVQQQQIVPVAIGEERGDAPPDRALVGVQEQPHVEAADRGIAQHPGERLGVVARRPQLGQLGIVVPGVGDHQCLAYTGRRLYRQGHQRPHDLLDGPVVSAGQVDLDAADGDPHRLPALREPCDDLADGRDDLDESVPRLHRRDDERADGEDFDPPGALRRAGDTDRIHPRGARVGQFGPQRQGERLDDLRAAQLAVRRRDAKDELGCRSRGHETSPGPQRADFGSDYVVVDVAKVVRSACDLSETGQQLPQRVSLGGVPAASTPAATPCPAAHVRLHGVRPARRGAPARRPAGPCDGRAGLRLGTAPHVRAQAGLRTS
jgi:hypothetical protein